MNWRDIRNVPAFTEYLVDLDIIKVKKNLRIKSTVYNFIIILSIAELIDNVLMQTAIQKSEPGVHVQHMAISPYNVSIIWSCSRLTSACIDRPTSSAFPPVILLLRRTLVSVGMSFQYRMTWPLSRLFKQCFRVPPDRTRAASIGANLWRNEVLTGGPKFSRSVFFATESPFEHTNYENTK